LIVSASKAQFPVEASSEDLPFPLSFGSPDGCIRQRDLSVADEVHNKPNPQEKSHGVCRWFCGSGSKGQA
jgi:hypothetical protein